MWETTSILTHCASCSARQPTLRKSSPLSAVLIPRFHLEGVEAGRQVSVYRIDPGTGERLGLLATATVGDGGWVDLTKPIIVRAGDALVAVSESTAQQ